jgi:poly-gamma-glutamate synthase PgsB/CapB
MAIRPELIAASERDLVRATIAVITNIRADHLEDTPSSAAVAEGFLGLVPRNGVVVVGEDALLPALRDRAGERGTKVVAVRISGLSADAANRAIASAVCEAAGIGAALPEAHAFAIRELNLNGKHLSFANAFACNDVASLDILWKEHGRAAAPAVALLNHRNDRPLRSLQFLDYFAALPRRPQILLLGSTFWLRRAARRRGLDCRTLPAMPWLGGRTLLERIAERVPEGALVWGVGNYHGRGAVISSALEQR